MRNSVEGTGNVFGVDVCVVLESYGVVGCPAVGIFCGLVRV